MTMTVALSRDQLVALIGELPDEQVDALVPFVTDLVEVAKTEEGLEQLDRGTFRKHLKLEPILPEPTITELSGVTLVGSDVSLDDQITAGGYESIGEHCTVEDFSLTLPAGPQSLVLAEYDVNVRSDQVESWATAHGYELALIDDLLAIGSHEEYCVLQRQFPIVALGSSTGAAPFRRVPILLTYNSNRWLRAYYWDYSWSARHHHFLLRKVSKPAVT